MFHFGVDYYPEHWPEERWPIDADLMAAAGVNVVRLAEFAWSFLEPHPGHFDFAWLDRALEVLHSRGIRAILCTPTASPAPWVMAMLPDAFRVPASGRPLTYGCRREYCPTHPGYRERGRVVTQAMAEYYTRHPAVIGWQIDNELSGHCFCPSCQVNFQAWLRARYGDLQELNSAWGTAFWSHVYTEWSQIPLPLESGAVHNPGLDLDYRRFMSDAYVRFQQEQVDILRAACPNHFVTHNFMGFGFDQLNYFDLARTLDFVAWDNYPRGAWQLEQEVDPAKMALGHATMRGLKGRTFWLMEQQSGSGGWNTVALTPRPGEMRLWTYQAIAHGADAIVYFRWRTARHGTEQYWHGVLDHHAQPRRRYAEFQTTGLELQQVGEQFLEAENRNQVAMLLSYDTRWAFQVQPNHPEFKYAALFAGYYKALHSRNVGIDIVPPDADLSRYRLVLALALHVLGEQAAANLRAYVQNGGTLLVTARTGVKDESNAIVNQPLPGLLSEVCGVEVDEYDVLPPGDTVPLAFAEHVLPPGAAPAAARLWCDVLSPAGNPAAETVATYQGAYFAGRSAVTLNNFGQGKAVYVGALDSVDLPNALAGWLIELAGVTPLLETPSGVEAVARWRAGQRLLFLLNHTSVERTVELDGDYRDLLTGAELSGQVSLPPYGVLVAH